MPKSKTTKQQIKAIRGYVKQGYSANKIQKRLQKQGLGIRRKVLLAKIRKIKHQKPKANRQKYVPYKYRVGELLRLFPLIERIAVYGTVRGRPRRVQTAGTGEQLYRTMLRVARYPPKKQFLTISAVEVLRNPWKYLDWKERWDRHPDVRS